MVIFDFQLLLLFFSFLLAFAFASFVPRFLPFSSLLPCAGSRDLMVLSLHDRASGIGVFYMMEETSI
jgi:hypothetical protein